jgi:hypothetical protein
VGYRFVPAKGGDEGRVPRSSRPEDLDPGVTEANGLARDEQARTQTGGAPAGRAPAGRAQPGRAQPGRAPKDSGQQGTGPKEASAAPADRR